MRTLHAIVSVLVFTAFSAALAQQPVAAHKHDNKGPTLAETMQLLQKELNAVGKFNFTVTTRDERGGPDHISHDTLEISNVVADPASCTVRYHIKGTAEGQTSNDDFSLNLHYVLGIRVMTYLQFMKEEDGIDIGDSNDWHTKVNPPMIMLDVQGEDGFIFADEAIANRIAKTLTRAVELCGGGNKDPRSTDTVR
jgi:hypothetical protein